MILTSNLVQPQFYLNMSKHNSISLFKSNKVGKTCKSLFLRSLLDIKLESSMLDHFLWAHSNARPQPHNILIIFPKTIDSTHRL